MRPPKVLSHKPFVNSKRMECDRILERADKRLKKDIYAKRKKREAPN